MVVGGSVVVGNVIDAVVAEKWKFILSRATLTFPKFKMTMNPLFTVS